MRTALLALPLLLAACGGAAQNLDPEPEPLPAGETFVLDVSGPSGVDLGAGATLAVTIYGYDPNLADASASVVHTQRVPLTSLPAELAIVLPDDAAARIDQGHGPVAEARARYYLHVNIDLDGDGQICGGELRQDYGTDGNTHSFGPAAPEASVPMPMLVIDAGNPCYPAFPGIE